ncbi:hypothetical protein JRQ81_005627, partial [Phrynocephalus forsythii]
MWKEFKGMVMRRFAYTQEELHSKLKAVKWDQKQSIHFLLTDIKALIKQWLKTADATMEEEIIDLLATKQLGWAIPPATYTVHVLIQEPEGAMDFTLTADELLSFKKYYFSQDFTPNLNLHRIQRLGNLIQGRRDSRNSL